MTDYRFAGMGYPNGPVDNGTIFSLPSDHLLMLSTEGRYHHDEAVRAGKTVVWRAIPRIGKRPAEVGWSPGRFVDEALNLTDEASEKIQEFISANELDLRDERGDHEDDFANLDTRYSLIGGFLYSAYGMLRSRLSDTRLHFPAFTPDHDALAYVDRWRAAAELFDVVDFHAYDTLAKIQSQYTAYRAAFPSKPIALTEWHALGDAEEEERILQWLAQTMLDDPLFDAAYRFIWQWFDHPGWWSDAYDVVHNPASVALFQSPPTAEPLPGPAPDPEPEPTPEPEPHMPELPRGIDVSNNNGTIDWDKVATAGLAFAFIKADEGDYFNDAYLHRNWTAAKRIGLYRGAYHFANPDAASAEASADHFIKAVNAVGLEPGDMLALDLEAGTGNLADWTLTWLQRVEGYVGFKPLVYTSPGFAHDHGLASRPELGEYGLWLASWGVPTPPQAPAPWDLVAFHQYQVAPAGTVPGIAGEIDMNRFNGPASSIPLYGLPADPEPVPGPEPPHAYVVGPGLLAKMQAIGDVPGSDERFFDLFSDAFGRSGIRYVYYRNTGEITLEAPRGAT